MNIEVEQFVTAPPFAENAFFIYNKAEQTFMVVDPGDGTAKKAQELINKGFKLERILITHVHIDHTWDLLKLAKIAPEALICLHADEAPMIKNYEAFSHMIGIYDSDPLPDLSKAVNLSNGDTFTFADKMFYIIHVPGHTQGHIAYYCGDATLKVTDESLEAEPDDADGFCFVGDLIFEEGVGRTDFPGGSWEKLTNSIKNKIYKLPEKTILYNGHGQPTTVKHEKTHNYFVRSD